MNIARKKYQVHAELLETGTAHAEQEAIDHSQTIERGLHRIERIAAVYLGQISSRLSNGLQITFDTAEAAILSACEMQRRCAALRDVTHDPLTLRIGIHQGIMLQRAKDPTDSTIEIASLLAIQDDGIVMSGAVINALKPELQKLAHPIDDFPPEVSAHAVDWRRELPHSSYWDQSMWPSDKDNDLSKPYLLLQHNLSTLKIDHERPIVTVGRSPLNGLVLGNNLVSRNHCRFERSIDCITVTDTSSNGTFIMPDKEKEIRLIKASIILADKGMIFFGREYGGDRRGGVKYEVFG